MMPHNQISTTKEYIDQLEISLKKHGVHDIEDILEDYQDYFAQSKAKGYSEIEAVRRLPSAQELAASYHGSFDGSDAESAQASKPRLSTAQRLTVFGITIAADIFLLPVLFITVVLLGCFSIVGILLIITGPLLLIPDSMLGQFEVARPPFMQIPPTILLFLASGTAIVGICVAIGERIYSTYRASIVVRRWLLTGKHNNYLKLIPGVSKRFRKLLYIVILAASAIALFMLLILISISWFTHDTIDFFSTWSV